ACDEDCAAPPLFGRNRGGKEVVGFVPGSLGIRKTACGDKFRQHVKLLEQFVIEFAAALIGRELLVTVVGASNVSQPTSTARGCSVRWNFSRKFAKPRIAPAGRPPRPNMVLGKAW